MNEKTEQDQTEAKPDERSEELLPAVRRSKKPIKNARAKDGESKFKREKFTKEELEKSLLNLSNAFDLSDREELSLLINKFEEEFKIDRSPETCYFAHWYKLDRAFDLWSEKFCVVPNKGHYLSMIYKDYKNIEPILSRFMEQTEGSACSVDRSRWLINSYIKYLKTGEMFTMDRPEKCYWMPRFGSADQWLRLIESCVDLRYGGYIKFIMVINELIEERGKDAEHKAE